MKTRPRDIIWALAATAMLAVVVASGVALVRGDGNVVQLLIGIIPATWLIVGCWRRTKWGAPAEGLRAHQEEKATSGTATGS